MRQRTSLRWVSNVVLKLWQANREFSALGVFDTLHFWRERQMLGIRVTYYDDRVKNDEVSVF